MIMIIIMIIINAGAIVQRLDQIVQIVKFVLNVHRFVMKEGIRNMGWTITHDMVLSVFLFVF